MDKMTESIIEDAVNKEIISDKINNKIKSPASDELFVISKQENNTELMKEDADMFHTANGS